MSLNQYYLNNKERILARNKKWRSENKIAKLELDRKWRLDNKSKINDLAKERYYNNLERERKSRRESAARRIEHQREYARKRRQDPEHRKQLALKAKQYREDPVNRERRLLQRRVAQQNRRMDLKTLTMKVVQQVYEENIQKYGTLTCELCLKPVKFGQDQIEHFHPISRKDSYPGDINERSNLGVSHGNGSIEMCNQKKNDSTLQEYLELNKE